MEPDSQDPAKPPERSVLRIPLTDAEALLDKQIEAGRAFQVAKPAGEATRRAFRGVVNWSYYNRTWINAMLGGEAASEYLRSADWKIDFTDWTQTEFRLDREIAKLESIRDRLHIWALPDEATSSSGTAVQALPDAPIFLVHGSDNYRAEAVARTVEKATGRATIILREQANLGRTLVEKFEEHAAQVSYAIIVLTPDDRGGRANESETSPRGRQNVIFEMGYFYGLIGRRNVSVLLHPSVEKPSDMDGIAYINFDDQGTWKTDLYRELREAGFGIQP